MPARNRLRTRPDIPGSARLCAGRNRGPELQKANIERNGLVASRRRGRATPRLITVPIKKQIATVVSQVPSIAPNILPVAAQIGQIP